MPATAETDRPRRPRRFLVASELPRAASELALFRAARPFLERSPRGDGHRVVVLPGLLASDRSTGPMRGLLGDLGYEVVGFALGRNVPSPQLIAALSERMNALRAEDPRPVSIVGGSLGGIYGRHIARRAPQWVRQVITLGSPFRSSPGEESTAAPLVRRLGGRPSGQGSDEPLPVPSTAVFSKTDGIVPWRACLDTVGDPHESIEVVGSHCGLGHHPAVLHLVADRLALPAGGWRPYVVPPVLRSVLRTHPGA